ncbi:MAG: N-6 DNA methylase [candidate division WOR-3 bacterium]
MKQSHQKSISELLPKETLIQLADKLVAGVKNIMTTAKTEEDLRIGFEKILEPIKTTLGITTIAGYEKTILLSGRSDAMHGNVIIEYEKPFAFNSQRWIKHAFEQLIDYIQKESIQRKEELFLYGTKLIGVGFDGSQIFFVKYQGTKTQPMTELSKQDFILLGPFAFNLESVRTFLAYLRSLARLPLTAEALAQKFGPKAEIAKNAVSAFADALRNWSNERVITFFNEWKRLFGIVYGEQFSSAQSNEADVLSQTYGIGKDISFQELLFAVHTYFALLMKLIAVELLTLKETSFTTSYSAQLTHLSKEELVAQLTDIEDGGIYAKKGITNFLEGDFFRWYLDAFSPRLEEAIREITRGLAEFEPATTIIKPEATRDLLKKLYQYLVPQAIRRRLGEYYTPDWLAELILNEVGYDGNTQKRLLDPACGSGTFLVFAIQRAKQYAKVHKEPPLETAKRIVANIWGFDLNPLAAIASRTNYLFALGDLVNELEHIEIPIYLADSVLNPTRTSGNIFGDYLEVTTSVHKFQIPAIWVKEKGFLLAKAAPLVEKMAKNNYSITEAMVQFKKEGLVFPPNEQIVQDFYHDILNLEKKGKNGIWARFLKNAFAPMIAGKFDFVVGNPPWIRWRFLSKDYKEATFPIWKAYGLFSLKGYAQMLGGAEPDFSMLFTYASADYYLHENSKLGFLITQEVFKSKGAGEGFRRFRLGETGQYLKVLKAHDLVTIQPFEGAANKTAAIILKKGDKTKYPLPYFVWTKKKGVGKIAPDKLLDEVLPFLQKKKYNAKPMGSNVGTWQTTLPGLEKLAKFVGENNYIARKGVSPEPYGVFWLQIKQVLSDGNLIIQNLYDYGKFKIQRVEERIEQDLVYPAIRGKDVERWMYRTEIYFILVNDPNNPMSGYLEDTLKKKYPRTYNYLTKFRNLLLNRAAYRKFHANANHPFYSQYNFGEYTLAPYKVVWGYMANDIDAAVVSSIKTCIGFKTVIPFNTITFFPTDNEPEAHYLCAIINSKPVRDFIKSFSSAGRGFGTPSVMEHIGIPKFDPKNKLHQKLTEISKKCHQLKLDGKEQEIHNLEKENDELVKKLFKIT